MRASTFRTLLPPAASVVVTLFAMFGGLLGRLVPPPAGPFKHSNPVGVGIAAFVAFLVLLAIVALGRAFSMKGWWIAVGVLFGIVAGILFVVTVLRYAKDYDRLTFDYPEDSEVSFVYIRGTVMQPRAQSVVDSLVHAGFDRPSDAKLVAGFRGDVKAVWTEQSLRESHSTLLKDYLLLIGTLATAVFCFAEVIVWVRDRTKPAVQGTNPEEMAASPT